jgi:hypothetical protein
MILTYIAANNTTSSKHCKRKCLNLLRRNTVFAPNLLKPAQTCLSGQGNEIDNQKTSGLLWLFKSYMEMY